MPPESHQDSTRNPISINREKNPTLNQVLMVKILDLIMTLTRLLTPLVKMRLRRTDSLGTRRVGGQLIVNHSINKRKRISITTNKPVH